MDPVIKQPLATVQQVSGSLKAIRADGREQELLPGDVIRLGDVLIAENGPARLALANGRLTEVSDGQTLDLGSLITLADLGFSEQQTVALIEKIADSEPTASGSESLSNEPTSVGQPGNSRFSPGENIELGTNEAVVQFGFETTGLSAVTPPATAQIPITTFQVPATPQAAITPEVFPQAAITPEVAIITPGVPATPLLVTPEALVTPQTPPASIPTSPSTPSVPPAPPNSAVSSQQPVVTIAANQPRVIEGERAGFTVSLDQVADAPVTIDLSYSGVAEDGRDLIGVTQVVIPAGTTSVAVDLTTLDDGLYEGNEDITVTVTGVSGADAVISSDTGSAAATVTVVDQQLPPVVTIAANQSRVSEGESAGFTVSLDQVADAPVTVELSYSGVAEDGRDLIGVTQVVIPAGTTSVAVDLTTLDDGLYEGNEDITVTVAGVSGADAVISSDTGSAAATVTVVDQQLPPVVTIAANQSRVSEGERAGFTVSLDQVADAPVTIDLSYSGVAEDGRDLIGVTQVVIPAGTTSVAVDLTTLDDGLYEGNEDITVTVAGVSGADAVISSDTGSAAATVTVVDQQSPPVVTIAANQPRVSEGESAGFTVSLDQVADAPVTIDLSYSGVAEDGRDLIGVTQVVIPAGTTSVAVDLTTLDDGLYEGNEDITVTVAGVSGADAVISSDTGSAAATVTVVDQQSPPVVTIAANQPRVSEGESAGFTVSLDQVADAPVTIDLSYSGVAEDGRDLIGVTQVVIPAGTTSVAVDLTTLDDGLYEGNEDITVTVAGVSGADAVISSDTGSAAATVTVVDQQSPPVVTIAANQPRVSEGESAGFTVSLDQVADAPVTIDLSYSGVAEDGRDLIGVTQVVIPAGTTSVAVDLTTLDDGLYEGNEDITVTVAGVSGADAVISSDTGSAAATVTVVDQQLPPVVTIAANQSRVSEGESAGFTVSLDQVSDAPVTVELSYSGVAEDGRDLIGVTQVVIPAGTTSVAVDLTTLDDGLYEGNEDITVTVTGVAGTDAVISSNNGTASASITVVDNDPIPVQINSAQAQTTEQGSDYSQFIISRDSASVAGGVKVTVAYTGESGDASDGDLNLSTLQYNDGSGWQNFVNGSLINFAPEALSFAVRVQAGDDVLFENQESFQVEISDPSAGFTVDSRQNTASGLVISDDQAQPLELVIEDNSTPTFNLLLSLDQSGSMVWASVDDPTRTSDTVAREALVELIDAYRDIGTVNVLLTTFANGGSTPLYGSASEISAYLSNDDNFSPGGGTNYRAGLETLESGFKDGIYTGKLDPAASSVVYFISDGAPTRGNPQREEWEGFLQDYNVDRSYAIGIQGFTRRPGNNPQSSRLNSFDASRLDDIAHTGSSITLDGSVSLVDTLVSTIPNTVFANLISHSLNASAAGSVELTRLTIDGTVYDLSANGPEQTVTIGTLGVLTAKRNGDLIFRPDDVENDSIQKTITYELTDNEGNSSRSQLILTVNDSGSAANFTFQANPNSNTIFDDPGSRQRGTPGDDRFTDNDLAEDFFARSGNDLVIDHAEAGENSRISAGRGNDLVDGGNLVNTLIGGQGRDVLYGGGGSDTLLGGQDSDFLVGGRGDDTVSGGAGNDLIIGGVGDDLLIGDSGSDTFQFSLIDLFPVDRASSSGRYTQDDFIEDFQLATPTEEGDILDLQELLVSNQQLTFEDIVDRLNVAFTDGGLSTTVTFQYDEALPSGSGDNQYTLNINLENIAQTAWETQKLEADGVDVLTQLINNGQLLI